MTKCKSYFGDYKCHVATSLKDSKGRTVYVDKCLKDAVENLNAQGLKTIASCCGHGEIQPIITIELTKYKIMEKIKQKLSVIISNEKLSANEKRDLIMDLIMEVKGAQV